MDARSAFEIYVRIGEALYRCSMDDIEKLKREMRNFKGSFIFYAIHLPSGEGKTQFSFSMGEFVCYFLVTDRSESSQSIYNCFSGLSGTLISIANKDAAGFNSGVTAHQLNEQTQVPLFIYGFIKILLEKYDSLNGESFSQETFETFYLSEWEIQRTKRTEVNSMIKSREKPLPIVVLDEVPLKSEEKKHFGLIRNAFRSFNFPLIVMGTNASLINLISNQESRGESEKNISWCRIIPALLPTNPEIIKGLNQKRKASVLEDTEQDFSSLTRQSNPQGSSPSKLISFINKEMKTCRPLFAHLIWKTFEEMRKDGDIKETGSSKEMAKMLQKFRTKLTTKIYANKRSVKEKEEGLYSQYCLMQNRFNSYVKRENDAVTHHFAYPE
jgi:hypothetical protein